MDIQTVCNRDLLRRHLGHGVIRMRGPVSIAGLDRHFGARIDARNHRHHIDTILHRADIDTKIAADALLIDHLEMPYAIDH